MKTPDTSVYSSQASAPSAWASATAVVSEPPRPRNVTSLALDDTPCAPPTTGTLPSTSAVRMRSGRSSMMRALVCEASVIRPAWLPVKESASTPTSCSARDRSAMALRSPAVMSMSISRPTWARATCEARWRSSSVSLPMALTTTTTSLPWRRVRAMWSATSRMRSGSATDVPPYFWTNSATGGDATGVYAAPGAVRVGHGRLVLEVVRAAAEQRPPGAEAVEQLRFVGVDDRAERADVVAPDRQDAAVEVAALEDDRLDVPGDRVGTDAVGGSQRTEVEHDAGLPRRHPTGRRPRLRRAAPTWARRRTRPAHEVAAGSGCGTRARTRRWRTRSTAPPTNARRRRARAASPVAPLATVARPRSRTSRWGRRWSSFRPSRTIRSSPHPSENSTLAGEMPLGARGRKVSPP